MDKDKIRKRVNFKTTTKGQMTIDITFEVEDTGVQAFDFSSLQQTEIDRLKKLCLTNGWEMA